jgi:dimethylglycine dehydrogenase
MNLYKELEAETGQSCGVFQPGSLYLAQTEDREHQLRLQEAKARRYGMNFHEVSRDEAERLHPLVDFDGMRCIMFEPDGGNVDPSGVTNAYAVGARQRGAEIHRFTPVIGTEAQPDGTWIVRTEKGDIATPWVVNAAGLWGREVAAMAGIDLPLLPTEHQYFVTETMPRSPRWTGACRPSPTGTGSITCARRGRACWSAPMRRTCASGPRTARRRASATSFSPTIWSGSRKT